MRLRYLLLLVLLMPVLWLAAQSVSGPAGAGGPIAQGAPAAVANGWPVVLENSGAALAVNNSRLITVADGINQGGGVTDLRIDGWGDGVATSYGAALVSSQLDGFNGTGFDRLRTSSADGASRVGQLEVTQAAPAVYINTASTTVIKAGPGILHRLIVNTPVAGATIRLYNVATAACTGIPASGLAGVITLPSAAQPFSLTYDQIFSTGICVVNSSASDLTLTYE